MQTLNGDWRLFADGYFVSLRGEVWSSTSNKFLQPKKAKTGYALITLPFGTFYLHDVVATTWLGPRPGHDYIAHHRDHDKTNNSVSNLEWTTRQKNSLYAAEAGALLNRRRGSRSKLSPEQVYEIRRKLGDGSATCSELATQFSVSNDVVRLAAYGKSHAELTDVAPLNKRLGTSRPGAGGKRRAGPAKATDDPPEHFVTLMGDERWKRLTGDLSAYWISSMGRVFSAKSKQLMKPQPTSAGYLRVQLRTESGTFQNKMIHCLVADNFLGEDRPEGFVAGHLNENPGDARVTNLAWMTREENARRAHIATKARQRPSPVRELQDFVRSLAEAQENVGFKRQDDSFGSLDLYVPSIGLGIQYDDVDATSERSGTARTQRLLDEQSIALDLGAKQVIRVFSTEWQESKDLVRSMLAHRLGKSAERVYARDTEVRIVSPTEARIFLDANHLQGSVGSSVRVGCYSGGVLLALTTFGAKRYGDATEGSYELLRYATKSGHVVVGGFSKLMKFFLHNEKVGNVVSFADKRWSAGSLYKAYGFTHVRTSAPNYFYFKRPDLTLKSRVMFQKHKLPSVLQTFDPLKTEVENMFENGWDRVWDCGNLVFELHPQQKEVK